jgi:hypothetical protein
MAAEVRFFRFVSFRFVCVCVSAPERATRENWVID